MPLDESRGRDGAAETTLNIDNMEERMFRTKSDGQAMMARCLVFSAALFSAGWSPSSQSPLLQSIDRDYLKGLRTAVVSVIMTEVSGVPSLTEQTVKTDIEIKLRQAGLRLVPVLTDAEASLWVSVGLWPLNDSAGTCVYALSVALREPAMLKRNPSKLASATIWSRTAFGKIGLRDIRSTVSDIADQLANDYLAANPR